MKNNCSKLALAACCFFFSSTAKAQLGNILGNVISSVTENKTTQDDLTQNLGSIFQNLIGTKELSKESVKGTWTYSSPAVAFESENLLKNAGGKIISATVEKTMQKYLDKIGFKVGQMEITFDGDSLFYMNIGANKVEGVYHIEGSNITLQRNGLLSYPVTANVAMEASQMNITFKADKFLEFLTKISSLTTNTTINAIGKLAGTYDGMQVGFQFTKKEE